MHLGKLGYHVSPGGRLSGRLRVPGDKSISHRAIMLGALADGITEISGFLEGADCLATLEAMRALGVRIEKQGEGKVRVHGVGIDGLRSAITPMDLGNSGTSMRLMTGILAGQPFDSMLVGDSSLSKRPMRRIIEPLSRMGAVVEASSDGTPPLRITGRQKLRGIHYDMPVASAQVKSALLLAGLYADGETCVSEPAPTRDHTERMLQGFGYMLTCKEGRVCLNGGGRLRGLPVDVPGDISSAAFFLVAASLAPDSDLLLEHVGVNPTRTGIIDILRLMGADINIENLREIGGEPVADINVRYAPLHGIDIPEDLVPLAIDEFPAIFIAAAYASGQTRLTGAAELRVKESDRIQVMADGLQACGVTASPMPDGIVIQGGTGLMKGAAIDSHGDHRIAMAFAMGGHCAKSSIDIHDCANVDTSFPGFVTLAGKAGLDIRVLENLA